MRAPLLLQRPRGGTTLTLNRPDALTALNEPPAQALRHAIAHGAEDPSSRAGVLAGAGRAFCVGQDLRDHAQALRTGQSLSTVVEHYRPPVPAVADRGKRGVPAGRGMGAGAGPSPAFLWCLRVAP